MAYADVRSKAAVQFSLIHCLFRLRSFVVVLCLVLVFYSVLLDGKEKAGCFTLAVLLMPGDSQCSVALPRGPVCSV